MWLFKLVFVVAFFGMLHNWLTPTVSVPNVNHYKILVTEGELDEEEDEEITARTAEKIALITLKTIETF